MKTTDPATASFRLTSDCRSELFDDEDTAREKEAEALASGEGNVRLFIRDGDSWWDLSWSRSEAPTSPFQALDAPDWWDVDPSQVHAR